MSDLHIHGPGRSKEPFSPEPVPSKRQGDKTGKIASQYIGKVSGSKTQALIKGFKLPVQQLSLETIDFAQKIVQKIVKESKSDKKVQLILEEFKSVDNWISDFEKMPPLNLEDENSFMMQQHHIVDIRDRLQQIREKTESFKDPRLKSEIFVVADTLMARLTELLNQRFDAAEFFRVPEKKQPFDDELANYFQPEAKADLDTILNELEQFPEGEVPDDIPKKARNEPREN